MQQRHARASVFMTNANVGGRWVCLSLLVIWRPGPFNEGVLSYFHGKGKSYSREWTPLRLNWECEQRGSESGLGFPRVPDRVRDALHVHVDEQNYM